MDKLDLNLDDLEVNSFTTAPEDREERGTVQGNDHTPCCTEHGGDTCDYTCGDTCGDDVTCVYCSVQICRQ